MIDVDIDVELFLASDDGRINQCRRRELVPHETRHGILRQIASYRRVRLGNGSGDLWGHASLDGNINGRDCDLLPRRAHDNTHRFRIEPPVEFAPAIDSADSA